MTIQKNYFFNLKDFKGNQENKLFSDFVKECESDFHENHKPKLANVLHANSKTMLLLKLSFYDTGENVIMGMESFEGKDNVEANLELSKYSENQTIFALGNFIDDEALYLISDNDYDDGVICLEYIPDNDEGEVEIPANPTIEIKSKISNSI